MAEFLPTYRAEHPLPDEQVRLTLIGSPEGATVRNQRRTTVLLIVGMLVGLGLGTATGRLMMWTAIGSLAAILVAALSARPGDLPIGVSLSDKRLIVAQQRRRAAPVVLTVRPPEDLAQVELRSAPSDFSGAGGHVITRLGVPSAALPTIEFPRMDPVAIVHVFTEAGVAVDSHLLPASGPGSQGQIFTQSFGWMIRAFLAGFGYFVGVGLVLISGAMVLEGDATAAAMFGVGLVFALGAEGLRRLLFRPDPPTPPSPF